MIGRLLAGTGFDEVEDILKRVPLLARNSGDICLTWMMNAICPLQRCTLVGEGV